MAAPHRSAALFLALIALTALIAGSSSSSGAPGAPRNLTVHRVTATEAHLTWARPNEEDGDGDDGGRVSGDHKGDEVEKQQEVEEDGENEEDPFADEIRRTFSKRRRSAGERRKINYALYYERGPSGAAEDPWRDRRLEEAPPAGRSVGNRTLTHAHDGAKYKFVLGDLSSFTRYRIWVRAYYADAPTALSRRSARVACTTEVRAPSAPIVQSAACDQPEGTLYLQWARPRAFDRLDSYRLHFKSKDHTLDLTSNSSAEAMEIQYHDVVPISNNVSVYEITIYAVAHSAVNKGSIINGTKSDPVKVTMTRDCIASKPPIVIFDVEDMNENPEDDKSSVALTVVGYLILLLIFGCVILLTVLALYHWGCTTVFKKCFPMSYLFLDEGGIVGSNDGCGEFGQEGKDEIPVNCIKKASSPTHAVIFWGAVENGPADPAVERLWDPLHPPVSADKFLAHTSALHADGDIGFSKEYELIQSKSSMLAHTSHHSQMPENRHKNRYLNITAYDHSRVCLLPSSTCPCEPGKEHRKSCTSKANSQPADSPPPPPHCDYVNANFIDGIVAEIDAELAKYIIEQNDKRRRAKKKNTEAQQPSDLWITIDEGQRSHNLVSPKLDANDAIVLRRDSKNLGDNIYAQDSANALKSKLTLDLDKKDERKILSPTSEILASTCRLSINLDRKDDKSSDDNRSEKSHKELIKSRKRSTSADTRDIVLDKKNHSRGHSKNSSVVVATIDNSPSKIEGGFLNIEFTGIVDSERELQKARELERLNEANKISKMEEEETLDSLDDLYVQIDGESYRVNSSWLLDRRRYIGTQGPTPGTLPAFWRMVWDHKVVVIVMITNLVERGRRKCDMYWPKEGTESYGVIQVTMLKEDVMATYTVRTFHIKNVKTNVSRSVLQYHYTVWPDHGTPEHPLAVLRFREAARKAALPQVGTVLVHCSAGVGRTGTYIVLDAMLNHLHLTGSLNVFGFLCHVRSQRNFLVQTEEQYVFIHDALLEAIQSGDTEVYAENAKQYLKKLLEPFPKDYFKDTEIDAKCGPYGVPIVEKPKIEPIGLEENEEPNFAMWNNVGNGHYTDKTLNECQNDIVSVSLMEANAKQAQNVDLDKSKDLVEESRLQSVEIAKNNHLVNGESLLMNHIDHKINSNGNNPNEDVSPELIAENGTLDNKVVIDIENLSVSNSDIKRTSLISDKNIDSTSINSTSLNRSDQFNSYEKINGISAKEESKTSSMSNEEVELSLNDNPCNGLDENGAKDASNDKNADVRVNGDNSHTITSSISSDTNNVNMANAKDKVSNYSPALSNHDCSQIYRNSKNFRPKTDDNYELLSGSSRPGGLGGLNPDFFAGSHQFSCQKKDFNAKKARNLLEQQFKLVTSFEPSKFHMVSAYKQVNANKNRQGAVLPVESGRVHLIPKPGIEGTDYINATWLQGHRLLREYVVTQHPLPNTLTDLYRLLWDHSCQIVVVLTDLMEDEECKQFWPSAKNPEMTTYNYSIHYMSEEKHVAKRMSATDANNESNLQRLLEDDSSIDSPLQSPSSTSNKKLPLKLNNGSQRGSLVSPTDENREQIMENNHNANENGDTGFYRRQFSSDNQDEEKLIPKSEDEPSLDGPEALGELQKLNNDKPEGYAFDKSELRIDTAMANEANDSPSNKASPKSLIADSGPASPNEDTSKKSQKSPSKLSLKSFRIGSPSALKSPAKFKFEFGSKNNASPKSESDSASLKSPPPAADAPTFESKFAMIPFVHLCQLREGAEEIGMDCIISTTHVTMNSLQDDYELKIKIIECPKWLADLDYDENSDTDEESDEDDYEMEKKDLDYVIEQRLKAYKGAFALPEYVSRCQDEAKNSPVVVIDKYGGARAVALCTLGGVLRKKARDIYSLAKLHHGRRAGAWRRPADIRAMYESIAAYEHPPTAPTSPQ